MLLTNFLAISMSERAKGMMTSCLLKLRVASHLIRQIIANIPILVIAAIVVYQPDTTRYKAEVKQNWAYYLLQQGKSHIIFEYSNFYSADGGRGQS